MIVNNTPSTNCSTEKHWNLDLS